MLLQGEVIGISGLGSITSKAFPGSSSKPLLNDAAHGRPETAEEVAKAVIFLSSCLSGFATPVSLSVMGGSYMD